MSVATAAVAGLHHVVATVAAMMRRASRSLWTANPPEFCRDWQTDPPAVPLAAGTASTPPALAVNGTLIGMLIATTIRADEIATVLPRGLSLPKDLKPTDEYPASIAFGFQDQVKPARWAFLPGADYVEFAVGIAGLELSPAVEGFAGPCAILGRLDLNELLPIVLGRLLGLQKVLRVAHSTPDEFKLKSFWKRSHVARGSLRLVGQPVRASDCTGLAPLIRTFEQPVVSRSIVGSLAFTRFTWHWDQGVAQEIACDVDVVEGLGVGRYVHPSDGSGTRPCTGAWQIRVPWTMEGLQSASSFARGEVRRASSTSPSSRQPG